MLLLVFGFLVYLKISHNSRAFSRLRRHLRDYINVVTSMLSRKQNVLSSSISTRFFNWKIAVILFVSVINYYE